MMEQALQIVQALMSKATSDSTKQDLATLEEYITDTSAVLATLKNEMTKMEQQVADLRASYSKLELFLQHVAVGMQLTRS